MGFHHKQHVGRKGERKIMINIVVLMAGEGRRFKDARYSRIKPFIKISERMMIEHVLDGIRIKDAKYLLVVRESFFKDYTDELKHLQSKYNVSFSSVRETTTGALATALSVYNKIMPFDPVIFVDSDNLFDNIEFGKFVNFATMSGSDACVLTANSDNEKFSYVKLNSDNGFVSKIAEKKVVSNMAVVGAYMFSTGMLFQRSAVNTIIYPPKEKEYYMSCAYNTLIEMGGRVSNFQIDATKWKCVGTPEQLKELVL